MKTHCRRSTTVLAVCCVLLAAPALRAQDVEWRYDYNRARTEASEKSRPILLDFGTEHCVWCKQLDTRTFTDPEVRALLNERFIPLKIDGNRNPEFTDKLHIRNYPTLVFAAPDGRILGFQEGFVEPAKLREQLVRVLASTTTPEWMTRDFQEAVKAQGAGDPARTVSLLKNIVDDGKERPVQVRARQMLAEVENQAAAKYAQARNLIDHGELAKGNDALKEVIRNYAGTPAARDANVLIQSIANRMETGEERTRRARDLLSRAKEDYRAQLYLCCLDRCEVLMSNYSDMAEAGEASQLALEIKTNPEWTKQAADQVADRLCQLYLTLADSMQKKGQPQQALFYLDRIVTMFPNTRHAEVAQIRVTQIKGISSKMTDFKK